MNTLTTTIEAALEIALIFANITRAVMSGELTPAEGEEIKQAIMRG